MFNLFNRVNLAPPGTTNGGGVAITAGSSAIGTARQVSDRAKHSTCSWA